MFKANGKAYQSWHAFLANLMMVQKDAQMWQNMEQLTSVRFLISFLFFLFVTFFSQVFVSRNATETDDVNGWFKLSLQSFLEKGDKTGGGAAGSEGCVFSLCIRFVSLLFFLLSY